LEVQQLRLTPQELPDSRKFAVSGGRMDVRREGGWQKGGWQTQQKKDSTKAFHEGVFLPHILMGSDSQRKGGIRTLTLRRIAGVDHPWTSSSEHMFASVMVRVAVFLAASTAIIRLSWRSLGDLRSHGFYRFIAFELLVALVLLNVPV
jgi:hypothetical protein